MREALETQSWVGSPRRSLSGGETPGEEQNTSSVVASRKRDGDSQRYAGVNGSGDDSVPTCCFAEHDGFCCPQHGHHPATTQQNRDRNHRTSGVAVRSGPVPRRCVSPSRVEAKRAFEKTKKQKQRRDKMGAVTRVLKNCGSKTEAAFRGGKHIIQTLRTIRCTGQARGPQSSSRSCITARDRTRRGSEAAIEASWSGTLTQRDLANVPRSTYDTSTSEGVDTHQ